MPARARLLSAIDEAVRAAEVAGSPLNVTQLALKLSSEHSQSGLTLETICDLIAAVEAAYATDQTTNAEDFNARRPDRGFG